MNNKILNYIEKTQKYYGDYSKKLKGNLTYGVDSKYTFLGISPKFTLWLIFLIGMSCCVISLTHNNISGIIFSIGSFLTAFATALLIIRKMAIHDKYLENIEKNIDMNKLKKYVFDTHMPNINQLEYLKSIISATCERNKNNRNAVLAFSVFVIVLFKPITDIVVKKYFTDNSFALQVAVIIFFTVVMLLLFSDRNSKMAKFGDWLIPDREGLLHLENLIDYLIYNSK